MGTATLQPDSGKQLRERIEKIRPSVADLKRLVSKSREAIERSRDLLARAREGHSLEERATKPRPQ